MPLILPLFHETKFVTDFNHVVRIGVVNEGALNYFIYKSEVESRRLEFIWKLKKIH